MVDFILRRGRDKAGINITNDDLEEFQNMFELLDHVYQRVVEQRINFTKKTLNYI